MLEMEIGYRDRPMLQERKRAVEREKKTVR